MYGNKLKSLLCQSSNIVKTCSRELVANGTKISPSQSQGAFFIQRQLSLSSGSSYSKTDSSDIELAYATYPQDTETQDTSKRPLIFLHGLYGAKGNLHSIAKHLASDGRKIVTYDARNHGDSGHADKMDFHCMSDDLQDLIQELQLGQPIVLGHSLGGKSAIMTALTKPDSLSALIVGDVLPNQVQTPAYNPLREYAHAMKSAQIIKGESLIHTRKSLEAQLTPAVTDRSIRSFLLTNVRMFPDGNIGWRINLEAIINNFDDLISFPDMTGKSFSKPTLFIFGSESYVYKNLDTGLIKQLFPSCEIDVIQGAGHFVHSDKPLEFVSIVQEFIKTAGISDSKKN